MRLRVRFALAVVLFVVAACSGSGQLGHTFELIEENGIPVAINSAVPKYDGELFVYEKILEIRPHPDNDESLLYMPHSFTLGDDDLYYVADNGNHRVAVFDAEGDFVRAIGRAGEGPGEFSDPVSVEARVGIVTVFGRRTSRFRTDGTFIDVLGWTGGRARNAHAASDGTLVVSDNPQGPKDDGYYYVGTRLRMINDDAVIATVETPQIPFAKMQGGNRAALHYVGAPMAFFLPGDEILATTGVEPMVNWYGLDGELRRQVRIDLPSEPVTEADVAVVEDRFDRLLANGMNHGADESYRDLILAEKAKAQYAETKAHWRRVIVEDTGWLWLRFPIPDIGIYYRGTPRITQQQSFRIVDPNGEFIGVTDWPPEVAFFATHIARGHLLAMIADLATGETVPTVYRIRPRVEGLVYP